jgi:exodeoxyribonuclease VII large subunit
MIESQERKILSVSQLNRRAKQLLETHLPLIWVSGEISNLTQHGSGHWYFTLKDEQAQIRCAMFRGANQRLRWQPKVGDLVLVRARVSLYEGRGDYQLIVEHMEAAGAGQLQQQFEAIKAKLAAEGLFDEAAKQDLPTFPKHIGIITSPTGAAIHDILTVLRRRYPIAPVTLAPVSVQGENAHQEMIAAIDKLNSYGQCDIIIIGRGGGSIEDLWAFNNEQLARAIYRSPIPIVSAVGHEVDITISDFVADLRAPTPTASAELITPDIHEWQQYFDYQHEQLQRHMSRALQKQQQQITYLRKQLRHPKQKLAAFTAALSQNKQRLNKAIENLQKNKAQQLQHFSSLLNTMSPLAVLSRGYSITRQKNGDIVKSADQIKVNDEISTFLSTGKVTSVITSTED